MAVWYYLHADAAKLCLGSAAATAVRDWAEVLYCVLGWAIAIDFSW